MQVHSLHVVGTVHKRQNRNIKKIVTTRASLLKKAFQDVPIEAILPIQRPAFLGSSLERNRTRSGLISPQRTGQTTKLGKREMRLTKEDAK